MCGTGGKSCGKTGSSCDRRWLSNSTPSQISPITAVAISRMKKSSRTTDIVAGSARPIHGFDNAAITASNVKPAETYEND